MFMLQKCSLEKMNRWPFHYFLFFYFLFFWMLKNCDTYAVAEQQLFACFLKTLPKTFCYFQLPQNYKEMPLSLRVHASYYFGCHNFVVRSMFYYLNHPIFQLCDSMLVLMSVKSLIYKQLWFFFFFNLLTKQLLMEL